MNFMTKIICCSFLCLITFVNAIPSRYVRDTKTELVHKNYAGEASKIVTASIFKHNVDDNNLVFSPFGFSSILTIISEGARGDSYKEIYELLKHSADIEKVRIDYSSVLKRFKSDNPLMTPQFKTWFYIYRNNTAEQNFKDILSDHYHVEVKDINREVYDWTEPKTTVVDNSKDISDFEDLKKSESFDVITPNDDDDDKIEVKFDAVIEHDVKEDKVKEEEKVETVKEEPIKEEVKEELIKEEPKAEPAKDVKDELVKEEIKEEHVKEEPKVEHVMEEIKPVEHEALVKEEVKEEQVKEEVKEEQVKEEIKEELPKEAVKEELVKEEPKAEPVKEEVKVESVNDDLLLWNADELAQKKGSKFDQNVEDKQYVEVPLIKKEIAEIKLTEEKEEEKESVEDNETIRFDEKLDEKKLVNNENENDEPTRIRLSLKKLENLEIMQAVENHPIRKRFYGRSMNGDDVASAISGNSLVSEKTNENANGDKTESKMLLFNGLYFRGSWAIPFQQLRTDPQDVFYVSPDEKEPVQMMRSRGAFKMGESSKWNSQVIELKYQNDRYSFLIVVPEKRENLDYLLENFGAETITELRENLKLETISLSLPKFRMETTSRAEKELTRCGLKTIFTKNADLSGISKEQKLHLEELVQHVSMRVDEGASSENFLTATSLLRNLDSLNEKSLIINKPFLYFVRDCIDDILIVAGKYMSPPIVAPQDDHFSDSV